MAIAHTSERMIQIGDGGGIWIPDSMARRNRLKPTTKNGKLVEDPPIPSVIPNSNQPVNKRMFDSDMGILETEIEIPRPLSNFLIGLRNALILPPPREVLIQLRRVVASSGFML